ncbi:MAG: transcriptional repressor [Candidatus Carbobacillus altaicus]|uniref:Zinc uptake regulation protein ZUR n=1 Tax=Candidatus Carbonibacillus altaicus TaxID=2163959 RepID=A0A2R6Y1D3_9BACL|nr:transcriptional repressor [Candidatus Carbobacillus altaicus]PTQ56483.1 MAG: Zinc uptake regulation protein ZUR [Candidatus Carbobacillus altaicus]
MTVEEALQILQDKGYKYTGRRETLIRILDREDRYVTAKDLLEEMQEIYPELSFDTIYRNLGLFHELGIVSMTELAGERRYRMRCNLPEHHHHMICLICGKTREIKACPLDAMWGDPEGFQITDHKFEVYGYCQACIDAGRGEEVFSEQAPVY